MNRAFSMFRVQDAIVLAILAPIVVATVPGASAQDKYDGAVWRFEMKSNLNPERKLYGRYRVSNHVLFQKDSPSDATFSKRVGTNHPNGKKTRFEVHDFRAFRFGQNPGPDNLVLMKGTGRIEMRKTGEWEGIFTDGMGRNWSFEAFRIIE